MIVEDISNTIRGGGAAVWSLFQSAEDTKEVWDAGGEVLAYLARGLRFVRNHPIQTVAIASITAGTIRAAEAATRRVGEHAGDELLKIIKERET